LRILLASRNFFPAGVVGGGQTSFRYLADYLTERGHTVAVLSIDDFESRGIHGPTGIPEYRLKIRNSSRAGGKSAIDKIAWHFTDRYAGAMRAPFTEVLDEFRPDVMLTGVMAGMTLGLWDAAADRGVPVVHRSNDYYLLCIRSGMRKNEANCETPCSLCNVAAVRTSRRKSQLISDVIYVSDHIKRVHEANGLFRAPVRAHVHPGGPYRRSASADQIAEQRALRSADPVLTLGYFGRVSPEKGVPDLIRTLLSLEGKWRLLIGGDGPPDYVERIRASIGDAPVELLGVRTPDEFFAMVDALIVPSLWHDPAPRVVYEAGAHGVASIVSDRGGLPELAGYGSRGFIYRPDQPETLRAIVQEILKDRSILDEKISRWAKEAGPFTIEGFGSAVEDVLIAAADAGRTPAHLSA
jgi:glycosyltransferase involved in cell wall biosynthesis